MKTNTERRKQEVRNDHGLIEPLFQALCHDEYDYEKAGDISATGLIKPPRIAQLERRYGHLTSINAGDRWWSVLGTGFHHVVEQKAKALGYAIVEERIGCEIRGWKVTCKPDLFMVKDDVAKVYDWKLTGVFGYKMEYEKNGGAKKEWEQQLNVNSAIIRRSLGWPTDELAIGVMFRDWKKSELEKAIHSDDASYPEDTVLMVPIKLWTAKEQDEYLEERVALHQEAAKCEDAKLPLCTPDDRWERGEKWAAMKGTAKRAVKLFTDPLEAEAFVSQTPGTRIEHRPGRAIRCESYCTGRAWCDFYQQAFNKPAPAEGEVVRL